MEYATMLKTCDSAAGGYVVELDSSGKQWDQTDRAEAQTCRSCGRCGGRSLINGVLIVLTLISFTAHFLQFLQISRLEETLLSQRKELNDIRTDKHIDNSVHEALPIQRDHLHKNNGADSGRSERSGPQRVPHFYLRGGGRIARKEVRLGGGHVFLWEQANNPNDKIPLISPEFLPIRNDSESNLIKALAVRSLRRRASGIYYVFGRVTVRGRRTDNSMATPAVVVALKKTSSSEPNGTTLIETYLTQDNIGNSYRGQDRYPVDSISFQGYFYLSYGDKISVEISELDNRQFTFFNGPKYAEFGAHLVEKSFSNDG